MPSVVGGGLNGTNICLEDRRAFVRTDIDIRPILRHNGSNLYIALLLEVEGA